MACRHRNMWMLAGGHVWWCYECGAVRLARKIEPGGSAPLGGWMKPAGKGAANPACNDREWARFTGESKCKS